LSFDEAIDLLENIARQQDDQDLAALIPSPLGRARIRVLRHLAGGNHRVHVIFSQFLTRDALDDLIEPFLGMLDDLSPYYQARIASLSPQQRKIVEYLCEVRGAIPVKQIAQRNFMSHQTASSQLRKLQDWGYVRFQSIGRESFYELREPLMRLCIEVKKSRGEPIGLFVDFLRLWYTPPDLQQHLTQLPPGAVQEREYVRYALQETRRPLVGGMLQAGPEPGSTQEEDSLVSLSLRDYEAYVEDGDFDHALGAAEEMVAIRGEAEDWFRKGKTLLELERYEESLKAYEKAMELDPDECASYVAFDRAGALLALDRWSEGLAQLENALDRFEHTHRQHTRNLKLVLQTLFGRIDSTLWPLRITNLLNLYAQRTLLSGLSQALVQSIPALFEAESSARSAQIWFDAWQQCAGDRLELTIALRLLKTAVRFRQSADPRALLELPIEEREILEQVLAKTTTAQ